MKNNRLNIVKRTFYKKLEGNREQLKTNVYILDVPVCEGHAFDKLEEWLMCYIDLCLKGDTR